MDRSDRVEALLEEILETQRAHLEAYRDAVTESLEVQRRSVEAQANHIRMYRRIALVGGVLVAALLGLVLWLALPLL